MIESELLGLVILAGLVLAGPLFFVGLAWSDWKRRNRARRSDF